MTTTQSRQRAADHLTAQRWAAEQYDAEQATRLTRVGLVACCGLKLNHAAPARELYRSALFKKAMAHVEATCDVWFILSAELGLVRPDQVVAPYDTKLGTKTGPPIHTWAAKTAGQLEEALRLTANVELTVLAGEQYRVMLRYTDLPAVVPMRGLGIGEQLHYLTVAAAERAQA